MPEPDRKPDPNTDLWTGDEAYGTVLFLSALDRFGDSFQTWAPETMRRRVRREFGREPNPGAIGRLVSMVVVRTTDLFLNRVDAFVRIANSLNFSRVPPEVFDPADSFECAWGTFEAALLYPPSADEISIDVRTYIGEVLRDEGFLKPPPALAGYVEPDYAKRTNYVEADDPAEFESVYRIQESKTKDVSAYVAEHLNGLVGQLNGLRPRSLDLSDIRNKIGVAAAEALRAVSAKSN